MSFILTTEFSWAWLGNSFFRLKHDENQMKSVESLKNVNENYIFYNICRFFLC